MKVPIVYNKIFHIYNRGNNWDNIFVDAQDYKHFQELYEVYINPIAETIAWCLMKNHFHLLVHIKDETEIGFLDNKYSQSEDMHLKWKTYFPDHPDVRYAKKPIPVNQFKHLFNAYARWFNIKHHRVSSLFEKNFERKHVKNDNYLANLITYIHNNPVKHGFTEHAIDYPWSSYLDMKMKNSKYITAYFDSIEDFENAHLKAYPDNEDKIKDTLED